MLGGTDNIDAYGFYASARALLHSVGRGGNDQASIQQSLTAIQRAVVLDPNFAIAWVLKAKAHDAARVYLPSDPANHSQLADAAADTTYTLQKKLPQVHLERAFKAVRCLDWTNAEKEFAKASGDEMGQYAYLLANTGQIDRARDLFLASQAADPLNGSLLMYLMVSYDILGDQAKALGFYNLGSGLSNWPAGHFNALVVMWGQGLDNATTQSIAARIPGPVFGAMNSCGSPASIPGGLQGLYNTYADPLSRLALAALAAFVGQPDLALQALIDATTAVPLYAHKFWQPLFTDVRALQGYRDFMRNGGFEDYWAAYVRPPPSVIGY